MKTNTGFGLKVATSLSILVALLFGCGGAEQEPDPWLQEIRLDTVRPGLVVPQSLLRLQGAHFVDSSLGGSRLHLEGSFQSQSGETASVDLQLGPLDFVDFDTMQIAFDEAAQSLFPGRDGSFDGQAWVEVDSSQDGETYASGKVEVGLELRSELQPGLDDAQSGSLLFVNDRVEVAGDGFFLSESEGSTVAVVSGCVRTTNEVDCVPVPALEMPLVASEILDRKNAYFALEPALVGIHSGIFEGSVELVNRHASGAELHTEALAVNYEILPPTLFSVNAEGVSLGQYVELLGGGFVSSADGNGTGGTELFLEGEFTPTDSDTSVPVDLLLLPEVLEGRVIRYVMNEDDALGRAIDLRQVTGRFEGLVRLRVVYDGEVEVGAQLPLSFSLEAVKQVVYVRFLPDYVNTLRHFGLRAVDREIRERVLQVVARDYTGVNLEVRAEEPDDFALYSIVDIAGQDLNGLGLLGYDNTAGKDIGNLRLYDHIGGVNAVTQQDGYPGFGGVFIESMFAFSQHPKGLANSISGGGDLFDQVFDAFRPDMAGGEPVRASDFTGGGVSIPQTDPGCPASDRPQQIRCAIWVLGNIVGSTVSHEIAHSLGLANPDVPGSFHNDADEVNRLMDNGGDRPFSERAQLQGEGPGMFCRSAYDYLREILPSDLPADYAGRESCF